MPELGYVVAAIAAAYFVYSFLDLSNLASTGAAAGAAAESDESDQAQSKLEPQVYWKLLDAVQAAMAASIDANVDHLAGPAKAESLRAAAEKAVDAVADEQAVVLNAHARKAVVNGVLDEISGLGPLEKLVRQQRIRLIQVRGAQDVKVTVNDQQIPTDCAFRDDEHVLAVIRRVLEPQGKVLTPAAPALQVKLPDGASFVASVPPASPAPYITIKKSAA